MKVIQTLARYFPDKCGGIQVNLNDLLPKLRSHNIEIKIAAASNGSRKEYTYEYSDVEVYRYPVSPIPKTQPNHGQYPHGKFEYFANWLSNQKADIYHQHHWEVHCGLPHLRLAKELGMATVVTIHYPLPICQRTTLMFNGQQVCDGKIDVLRCSQCADTLSGNLPAAIIKTLSNLPISILCKLPLPTSAYLPVSVNEGNLGRFVRPFVVPGYVNARQQSLLEMAKFADRIIAVCDWLYKALIINGVPEEKLLLCRCGIADVKPEKLSHNKQQSQPLKVVFLGRWDIYKGVDILVRAVKDLPIAIPIELIIHGIAQDERYRKQILKLIGNDPRIRIEKQLTREELPKALASYDILAAPSQWLETGPLVVLEAHALSLPVIGSNLGGIAELVRHGIDGWLVTANDVKAWTDALQRLATDVNLLNQLRQGIKPVRTVNMQAADLAAIYSNLHH
ncbi:glycosyltransferase [Nostocaceae cyanobacterium CENA369]|uniref:Glycosyltransferase n=1 Tax=Dendronalium phyllosphericum CENA369 TaxID=1725256 RepID=A0A8J7I3X9_9NOST|nr:glycosyltransferase [Dendronalium phyllosphericum]MBH8574210.1 glycosyltransferase [Dendronalium phyllosphericum CENA369]